MRPKISVIIPVYNVELYLRQCLDSVVGQTLKELQIICVNDGSPDGSQAILDEYQRVDPRILVINQENQGLSGARNTGMAHITGEYTMFLDSDDWVEADCCAKGYAAAKAHDADVVLWNYKQAFETWEERLRIVKGGQVFSHEEVRERVLRQCFGLYRQELAHPELHDARVNVWGRLYRSEIIQKYGVAFVDTKRIGTEDALFNLYFFVHARSMATVEDYLNNYRMNNTSSLTSVYQKDLSAKWACMFSLMEACLVEMGLGEMYREALDNRVAMSILWLGRNILLGHAPLRQKVRELADILNNSPFRESFQRVDTVYFSRMWRVILMLCKKKQTLPLYASFLFVFTMSRLMEKNGKNKGGNARVIDKVAL